MRFARVADLHAGRYKKIKAHIDDEYEGPNLIELIDIVPVSVEIPCVEIELAGGVTNSI